MEHQNSTHQGAPVATILVTTETDYHGTETVTRRTLTPTEVGSRKGSLQAKTINAYAEGRGRRNRSPWQARSLGSAQGVIAPEGMAFTSDPQGHDQYHNAFPTGDHR